MRARAADRDTRQLSSRHPVPVDAYALLDHRTRESTVLHDVAPPGRYLAVEHDGRTWLISLSRPITHIGRGLIADVRLEDPHVSRRHAIIAIRGDGPDAVRVLDDRSSGGTFVNGDEVTVANLHDGDIVRVGRVVFRYTEIAAALKRSGRCGGSRSASAVRAGPARSGRLIWAGRHRRRVARSLPGATGPWSPDRGRTPPAPGPVQPRISPLCAGVVDGTRTPYTAPGQPIVVAAQTGGPAPHTRGAEGGVRES